MTALAAAQTPVGALAIVDRQGDQDGWAVDYETGGAVRQRVLSECGAGCSVVLTFERCAAYAWAESDGSAHRELQEGLQAAGIDPGRADGMFGLRTRSAIWRWQSSQRARPTGYLDGASVASLRPLVAGQPTFREREPAGVAAMSATAATPAVSAMQQQPPPTSADVELVFWQSIANSTNPVEFEAYLAQFPNGVFRALAEARLAVLRSPANAPPVADAPRRPGDVFRDCRECPEMVVLAGGGLAMGRYEVTVGEYRAFASATGGGAGGGCSGGDSWRDPGFPQTDRHPVTCVSWDDAQEYVSWLSRRTGAMYWLPTEREWERAASWSQPGCHIGVTGTCPVGSSGANGAGLSDMVGNLWEWMSDCQAAQDCSRRAVRGGSWRHGRALLLAGARSSPLSTVAAGDRINDRGFRVSRTLDYRKARRQAEGG